MMRPLVRLLVAQIGTFKFLILLYTFDPGFSLDSPEGWKSHFPTSSIAMSGKIPQNARKNFISYFTPIVRRERPAWTNGGFPRLETSLFPSVSHQCNFLLQIKSRPVPL